MTQPENLDITIVTMKFPVPSETFISGRLRALHQMGHRISVFALRREPAEAANLRRERSVDKVLTDHNSLASSVRGLLRALTRPLQLASMIAWIFRTNYRKPLQLALAFGVLPRSFDILTTMRGSMPDVVHFEWGHYPAVLARLIQLTSPRTVVSISLIAYDLQTEFGGTIDVARDADVIRTQAHVNVEQISKFTGVPPEPITVIRDGVDMAGIAKLTSVAEKVPGRVVVAGRLVNEKGVDDAIRVFANARASAPYAVLRVLGEGPELERLRALADELDVGDAVEFLGHVTHGQVLHELGCAEALLHLSHTERLPNVVKEAMATGCVPITTRTEGIDELVTHQETGFIVDHGDLQGAGEILIGVLSRQFENDTMTAAAKRFIYTNFDHQVNVDKLVERWREAMGTEGLGVKVA